MWDVRARCSRSKRTRPDQYRTIFAQDTPSVRRTQEARGAGGSIGDARLAHVPFQLLSEIVDDVLCPEETFEAGVEMHFATIAHGLFSENKSDFGAFDLDDTGSDDVVRGIWEIDENEYEYDEDEDEEDAV
jgi:hypothetical protein